MSIRQKLNQNSMAATAGAAAVVALALIIIIWQVWPSQRSEPKGQYFSSDEGKSYFAESLGTVPPITKDGKDAVQAMVFKCGWGKPFVGFLQRYTPDAKKRLEEALAAKRDLPPTALLSGTEAKRPGESEWVKATDERFGQITNVHCPDGKLDGLKTVWP